MICTLKELKFQLRIENDYIEEDEHLMLLLTAAERFVFNYLNCSVNEFNNMIPSDIKLGILIAATTFYTHPEYINHGNASLMPFHFISILSPYKNPIIV